MPERLAEQLRAVAAAAPCTPEVRARFFERIEQGRLTHDEDGVTHFCVYFLPYNPATKQVFIVHHKKSGLWISPGGHVDRGETLHETLEREMFEELRVSGEVAGLDKPFLLTITEIDNPPQPCRRHFDVWYPVPTDGTAFTVDMEEFHETRWLSVAGARELVTDPNNLTALDALGRQLSS
jgi:8-oxo-dGTP pyrophosphatase MutT (NUDIX family)